MCISKRSQYSSTVNLESDFALKTAAHCQIRIFVVTKLLFGCAWFPVYHSILKRNYEKYDTAFWERNDISQFNFYGIEHFLYLAAKNADDFKKLFDNTPAALKVELRLGNNEIVKLSLQHGKNPLAEAIYGEGGTFLPVSMPQLRKVFGNRGTLNDKHSLIIRYLEEMLVYVLKNEPVYALKGETIKNQKQFTDSGETEEIRYITRRDFLPDFLKHLTRISARPETYKKTVVHPYDLHLAQQFCAALEQIPDHFFKSGTHAEIYLKECETNFLETLMNCYDSNQENDEHELNHRGFLSFSIENLSTGELALIGLLETKPFTGYHFQIIIATHSPLLLSDVSRKDIIGLQ